MDFMKTVIVTVSQGTSYSQEYYLPGENKGSQGTQIMYKRKEIINYRMKTYKLLIHLKHNLFI